MHRNHTKDWYSLEVNYDLCFSATVCMKRKNLNCPPGGAVWPNWIGFKKVQEEQLIFNLQHFLIPSILTLHLEVKCKHYFLLLKVMVNLTGQKGMKLEGWMNKNDRWTKTSRYREEVRTYEVVIHSVLQVVLRDGVFSVDNLQLGPLLKWVLLKTQQVEDTS